MYKHTVETFGQFEKHILHNDHGDSFAVVPAFGANLLDLKFNHVSVLDGYQTPEELMANKWSKNIVLFPFPNRLKDGQYTHEGTTYQFEINNNDTQNAIHGFSKDVSMQVINATTDAQHGSIKCQFDHDGTHKAYPFKFQFTITFILRGSECIIDMQFTNLHDKAIPVGLGWHPYFRLSEKSDDVSLQMPDTQFIVVDERMLPTGEKQPYRAFENLTKIGSTFLDNGFYITDQTKNAEVILASELGTLTYWQETGTGKWNFVQIFTPPHRQSVAIEPMTCNIDAFNNQDGLTMLQSNESLGGKFGVKFSK